MRSENLTKWLRGLLNEALNNAKVLENYKVSNVILISKGNEERNG